MALQAVGDLQRQTLLQLADRGRRPRRRARASTGRRSVHLAGRRHPTRVLSCWNSSRSAWLPIGPARPATVARPSAVATMLTTMYGTMNGSLLAEDDVARGFLGSHRSCLREQPTKAHPVAHATGPGSMRRGEPPHETDFNAQLTLNLHRRSSRSAPPCRTCARPRPPRSSTSPRAARSGRSPARPASRPRQP